MDKQKRTKSADEQLHDAQGGDTKGKVIYDNEPASHKQAKESQKRDEEIAETFPASDPPAQSDPTTSLASEDEDK